MARFLLVHGSAHGAWCWREVVPRLNALGHEAIAIDLPSHGDDPLPTNSATLDLYAQRVIDHLTDPTIVVGHSMGGYVISHAAEQAPALIDRLIYLCAYLPWPGRTLAQMRKEGKTQPLLPALIMSEDRKSFAINPDMVGDVMYHDCSDDQVAFAKSQLCLQATQPSDQQVPLTSVYHSVPRSYIICNQDRTIPPELQRRMAADFDDRSVFELDTSHSPFFSRPQDLSDLFDTIARG